MASNPEKQRPEKVSRATQQLAIRFEQSSREAGVCNAFHIDRHSLPGFNICTFGAVAADEVISRWTFALEPRFILANRASLLAYATQVRKQTEVKPFLQPTVPISKPLLSPRPVDWIGVARQDKTAEFVFHGWSWHAATATATDPNQEKLIHAMLYLILRCPLELQISWIAELYDPAHIPKDQ
jgi:hypothetical protein